MLNALSIDVEAGAQGRMDDIAALKRLAARLGLSL
jgi:hypothetical protein